MTGQLKTKPGVVYDYETRSLYSVTVRATDPSHASATILVAIHVTDVPEKPVFSNSSTTRSFLENTPPGRNIGLPVTATDSDDDALTYTLKGPDAASFDLDALTGQLKTKPGVVYDYETRSLYSVTVRAMDPSHASVTIVVAIHVTDVPEKPVFPSLSTTRSFPENTPPGRNIGAPVTATDGDGDALTYALEGLDAASFDIDALSGQLKTKLGVTYDYETQSLYSVTVRATDLGRASATIVVAIHVTNVNEKPVFPSLSTTRSFPENTPPGRRIGLPVTATDGDGDVLTYTLEGPDAASFDLDALTGQLKTKLGVVYDYETRSLYSVTVRATDPGHASATILVAVHVTDVPEKPVFPSSSTTRSFPENTPPGRRIGLPVTATDGDGDALTYTLEGPDAASFDIDASTGQLKTKSGVVYDYETRSFYSVTVRATDPSHASATILAAIHVTDIPEKPATPSAPLVRALDGTSTVLRARWRAPARNGGPSLIGYDVEYRQGTSGGWRAWPHIGTRIATTITGLSTSTDYQVRVRALNGESPSDWSPPGSGRTNATVSGWLARFGRTVAQQMLEGVEDRLTSPRRAGLRGTIAGHGLNGGGREGAQGADDALAVPHGLGRTLARWTGGDADAERLSGPRLLTERDLLMGSAFDLSSEAVDGGVVGIWGRGGYSRFDGVEEAFLLDGDVAAATLGADYAKGPWLAGLALSHSWGIGNYGRAHSQDDIEALLTGLYPYAGFKATDRYSVWGVGGFGQGVLTLTPEDGTAMETDIGLAMAAIAARGVLVSAANGFNLALETDGFWVRTTSEAVFGLLAADAVVTRVRLGLESSYATALSNGSTLTPKLEIGLRHDGGDAETGWGVDVGGGLVWSAPARGMSVEFEARSLIGHQVDAFRDWGVSGQVRYDPTPSSDRGLSASLKSSIGSPSLDGAGALLRRETLPGLAAHDALRRGLLTAEAAYGFPILGGRFTGAPWVGAGIVENGRDYRVGYWVSPAGQSGSAMQFGIEGLRRENNGGDAEAEHTIGLRLALGW